jgi:hypothetical protein
MIIVCDQTNSVRQIKEDNMEEVFAITDSYKALHAQINKCFTMLHRKDVSDLMSRGANTSIETCPDSLMSSLVLKK